MRLSLPFENAVPSGWEVIRFGRLVVRSQESGKPDAQLLSVFLDQGVVPRDSREDNFNRLGADLGNYLVVRRGDLVFNKLRTWQGGLGVSAFNGIVSPAYYVCRPTRAVNSRYLHFLLRSRLYLAELTRISKWMPPSQFDISWDSLRQLPTLLPPIRDQRLIADYLDREVKQISLLVAAKNRMMRLLNEQWSKVLDDAIWTSSAPRVALRRVARFVDYRGATPAKQDNGVPLITASHVSEGVIDHSVDPQFIGEKHYTDWMRRGFPAIGDVLITTEAPLGEVAQINDPKVALAQRLILLKVDHEQLIADYGAFALRSMQFQAQLQASATGSTALGIKADRLKGLLIPVPSLKDQAAIVTKVKNIHQHNSQMMRALSRQITLLEELQLSVISAAVTGQLEIPEAA